jgi:hypothetical protein
MQLLNMHSPDNRSACNVCNSRIYKGAVLIKTDTTGIRMCGTCAAKLMTWLNLSSRDPDETTLPEEMISTSKRTCHICKNIITAGTKFINRTSVGAYVNICRDCFSKATGIALIHITPLDTLYAKYSKEDVIIALTLLTRGVKGNNRASQEVAKLAEKHSLATLIEYLN